MQVLEAGAAIRLVVWLRAKSRAAKAEGERTMEMESREKTHRKSVKKGTRAEMQIHLSLPDMTYIADSVSKQSQTEPSLQHVWVGVSFHNFDMTSTDASITPDRA